MKVLFLANKYFSRYKHILSLSNPIKLEASIHRETFNPESYRELGRYLQIVLPKYLGKTKRLKIINHAFLNEVA